MIKQYIILIASVLMIVSGVFAQQLSTEELKAARWLSQEEYNKKDQVGKYFQPTDAPDGPVNPVAEFEPMQAVLIAYPWGIPMDLIVEMSEDVMVTTIVSSNGQATSVGNQYESVGCNMDNIDFLIEPHDTYWTRDYGPWFIREDDQVSIINFTYNRPRPDDNIMPVNVADMLGISYYNMPVVHTGGNYMCDGFGIAAQTELVYQENTISNAQVDQYMEDYLGVSENYVVTDPLDDYIMHIDCWGKFLDSDKVLVAQVPESDYRYEDYEAAANYFATRNCAYGYPWEVVRVYAPGDAPNTPYTNSLILNKKVFVPITGSTHDDAALATYTEAMPGYEIIAVPEGSQDWLNSDALHCRTHEIADVNMLKITHIPAFYNEVEYQANYSIEAKIHAYSNENLYTDSLKVVYKINDGDYTAIIMESLGDEMYSADIPANPGDQIAYYIHAADESGRSENAPYIGAPDPFVFSVEEGNFLSITPDTVFLDDGAFSHWLYIENNTDEAIEISNIVEQDNHNVVWYIDEIIPNIGSFPYTLEPGGTIDVSIYRIITKSEIFYDSIFVQTPDSNYFSIVTGDDSVLASELDNDKTTLSVYPNPMNNLGKISFQLMEASAVELSIYNLQGQLVKTLENSRLNRGNYDYNWNGQNQLEQDCENGVYFIYLRIDDKVVSQKILKM